MQSQPTPAAYTKAIAEAQARREAQMALNHAAEEQAQSCVTFFNSLGEALGTEMRKANEGLSQSGFKDLFEGLYMAKPPEYRMIISFGGTPHAREISLDMEDRNYPTIHVKDAKDSPTGSLHFVVKDVGVGMQAFTTEGGGTANWSLPLSIGEVAARIVENVIDGLFR
ncbi:MAG TPA: hypothetical protein VND90_00820 [Terracidiphilus sp.]|nr:hypothetical protein [Terracidiphilus sp.]